MWVPDANSAYSGGNWIANVCRTFKHGQHGFAVLGRTPLRFAYHRVSPTHSPTQLDTVLGSHPLNAHTGLRSVHVASACIARLHYQ